MSEFALKIPAEFRVIPDHVVDLPRGNKAELFSSDYPKKGVVLSGTKIIIRGPDYPLPVVTKFFYFKADVRVYLERLAAHLKDKNKIDEIYNKRSWWQRLFGWPGIR